MNKLRLLLLKLLFPEFLELESFIDNSLNYVVAKHSKEIAILRHVIESEVWQAISEKYSNE